MTDLPGILRAEGLTVSVDDDWQTWHRPGDWSPIGNLFHHTGGHNDLHTVRYGRSDLKGPLANLYLARTGTVTVVSGGRCNHAGAGSQIVLDETRHDIAPSGTAQSRGLIDGPTGNGYFYGIEMECLGDGVEQFTSAQLDAMSRIGAALCRHHSWTANRNVGHLEWTHRKPDPRAPGFSMRWLRSIVAGRLQGVKPMFDPPLHLGPIVAALAAPEGGAWLLAEDGSVYAFGGATFHGGVNGQPFFAGRKAAQLKARTDATPGYVVVASSGEEYALPL